MSLGLLDRFLVDVFGFFAMWCGLEQAAFAQPKICGNQPALGGWSLASCPMLRDDDGDGIYSVTVNLGDTPLLEYKVLPTGMWDGTSEIRANGTCPADGGSKRNDTQNIQIIRPDTAKPATFYFDSRSVTDPSYSTAPGNRSAGDSLMMDAPSGTCPRWLAVGDFQNLPGPNSSAVTLRLLRPGVFVGRGTATKAMGSGWRWKVLEQGADIAREYGPSGWAYAPCEATPALVSTPVSVGDSIYFIFHAHGGRMQTVVSSAPLDGFSSDGSSTCQPPVDLGTLTDMTGQPQDGATAPLSDAGLDAGLDGGLARRPGIHCDCQIGAAKSQSAPTRVVSVAGVALVLSLLARRTRRAR